MKSPRSPPGDLVTLGFLSSPYDRRSTQVSTDRRRIVPGLPNEVVTSTGCSSSEESSSLTKRAAVNSDAMAQSDTDGHQAAKNCIGVKRR